MSGVKSDVFGGLTQSRVTLAKMIIFLTNRDNELDAVTFSIVEGIILCVALTFLFYTYQILISTWDLLKNYKSTLQRGYIDN